MSFALKVAHKGKVAILCKTLLEEANTNLAQGGIASVTKQTDDFEKHIQDTLIAGDGLCDINAVRKVVEEAPAQIAELVKWGVLFDKDAQGGFDLHREGGHSEFRILHHKDNTGAEIQKSLVAGNKRYPNIEVFEKPFCRRNYYAAPSRYVGKTYNSRYRVATEPMCSIKIPIMYILSCQK